MAGRSSTSSLLRCTKLREAVISRDIKVNCQLSPLFSRRPNENQSFMSTVTTISACSRPTFSCQAAGKPAIGRAFASQSDADVKKTPLYDLHVAKKAKFVPFGGYSMPLYYDDLSHVESHHWTREKASIFDVSHMVQHQLSGPSAEAFLMQLTPTALGQLSNYQSTLSCLLASPSGGIIDDTVITRLGPQSFYFVTNAGRREADLHFLETSLATFRSTHPSAPAPDWTVLNQHSLLALQGPLAASSLQPLISPDHSDPAQSPDLSTLHFGHARHLRLHLPDTTTTPPLLISRTGYTGEDGFEISIPPSPNQSSPHLLTHNITTALLTSSNTIRLAGLAARDSLRLEAGMCLYGHDIDISTTPPEAGLGWTVSKERRQRSGPTFNGSAVILEQLARPQSMSRRRVGLVVEKGPPAREGAEVVDLDQARAGEVVGRVTSGLPSPSLGGTNIAMALVRNGLHQRGTRLGVRVRGKVREAEVVKMPFVENKFYRGTG